MNASRQCKPKGRMSTKLGMRLFVVFSLFSFAAICLHSVGTNAAAINAGESLPEGEGSDMQKQLNDLLIWSIEHSNSSELKARATEALQDPESLEQRRAEIQALLAEMGAEPTERQLMEEALGVASNASNAVSLRVDALTALRYLVEPIDNAMDMPKLGGTAILAKIIEDESDASLITAAEYTLGTAASNNPTVQAAVLVEAQLMASLLNHAAHLSTEVSEKALYVISALVSSNYEGQQQFHSNKGVSVIRSLLANELSTRQHRKVLNLITDLTDVDGEIEGQEQFADKTLLKILLEDLSNADHDVKERAFLALISLSQHTETRGVVKAVGGMKAVKLAREQCRQLLEDADEDYREILTNLMVLGTDLEDLLSQSASDRTEL